MDDCRKKFHFNDTSPDHDQRWSCVQKCAKNEVVNSVIAYKRLDN